MGSENSNTILYIGINNKRKVHLLTTQGIYGLDGNVSVDVAQSG